MFLSSYVAALLCELKKSSVVLTPYLTNPRGTLRDVSEKRFEMFKKKFSEDGLRKSVKLCQCRMHVIALPIIPNVHCAALSSTHQCPSI